jgi:hypothetical protein
MLSPLARDRFLNLSRAAAIVALVIVAYLPAIRGGFVWDDDAHLKLQPELQSWHALRMVWVKPGYTPQYYPLTHTTFWIEANFWGGRPMGYHLVNVALHAINALLLWRVLAILGVPGAFLASAIFALHPVHVESVAWVTELKNVLSGFFYLASAIMFIRGAGIEPRGNHQQSASHSDHKRVTEMDRVAPVLDYAPDGKSRPHVSPFIYLSASLLLFVAAVLSKTVAGSLPAALALVLWWKRVQVTVPQALTLVLMLVIAVVMGSLTARMEAEHVGASGSEWNYTVVERVLIASRAVWFYLRTLLCPVGLMFFYPKWSVDPGDFRPWVFVVAGVALLLAVALSRKRLGRGVVVAILFFGGTLIPALGFVNVYPMRYSFVADHFQYLASIGIITLVAAPLARWERLTLVIPLILAGLTFQRSSAFASPEALWEDTLAKNPRAWIAHDQLAGILSSQGRYDEAAARYAMAIQLNPQHPEGYIGLGQLHLLTGNPAAAVEQMQKAVDVQPDKVQPHYGLGVALLAAGNPRAAAEAFQKAVELKPKWPPARLRWAEALDRLGESDKAAEQRTIAQRLFEEALGYDARP